jgi:hypothetical protein
VILYSKCSCEHFCIGSVGGLVARSYSGDLTMGRKKKSAFTCLSLSTLLVTMAHVNFLVSVKIESTREWWYPIKMRFSTSKRQNP